MGEEVLEELRREPLDEWPTETIYRKTLGTLRKRNPLSAGRYKLKRALMELGPSGYPFEDYVGKLFAAMGHRVEVGVILQGRCVSHEVDVVAKNSRHTKIIECKFRNKPGYKSDVKVPLYIHSRFKDIEQKRNTNKQGRLHPLEGWVVTNTAFTSDAIRYGNCSHLKLLGWNYPAKGNLKDLIEKNCLYPITCVTGLTKQQVRILLENKMVLAQDLLHHPEVFKTLNITRGQRKIERQVEDLCR